MKTKKDFLRKKIIHMRNNLNFHQRNTAAIQATKIALKYQIIKKAKNIALFLSCHGELNTYFLLNYLSKKKNLYLPVLHPYKKNRLIFIKYKNLKNLEFNKFKILQPYYKIKNAISLKILDIIIIPTLVFDNYGNRLGMGHGFYDRTLKKFNNYNFIIIGYAYEFQKILKIEKKKWDVPLSSMITDTKIYEWL